MEPQQTNNPETNRVGPDQIDPTLAFPPVKKRFTKGRLGLVIAILLFLSALIGVPAFLIARGDNDLAQQTPANLEVIEYDNAYNDTESGIRYMQPDGFTTEAKTDLLYGNTIFEKEVNGQNQIILVGNLDDSLIASTESSLVDAACSIASSMGEFFFPTPGERINVKKKDTIESNNNDGASCYYAVKPTDQGEEAIEPQIYASVVEINSERWWIAALSTDKYPIDSSELDFITKTIEKL